MATQTTSASQIISKTAKAEGGPHKGSASAEMQSQVGKTQNFEQAAQEVGSKIATNPQSVSSEDANHLKSREARATGQAQPPSDSLSAEAQRLAAANESGHGPATTASSTGPLSPGEQSALTKEQNFQQAASAVGHKMANNPESVTKEDGDLLHRREQRAHGHTEKQGIAAQAQSLAADNMKKGTA